MSIRQIFGVNFLNIEYIQLFHIILILWDILHIRPKHINIYIQTIHNIYKYLFVYYIFWSIFRAKYKAGVGLQETLKPKKKLRQKRKPRQTKT